MLAKEARPATPSACDQAGLTCLTSGRAVRGSERARAGPRLAPTALVPAPKRDTGPACLRALTTGYARNGHDMTASRDSAIRRLGALPTRARYRLETVTTLGNQLPNDHHRGYERSIPRLYQRDSALMDDRAHCRPHPEVITHVPRPDEGRHAKAPVTRGQGLRTTERAGAHSLQFGTYALWTAGMLAALAVRPVPSYVLRLARA